MAWQIHSTAFTAGGEIPPEYTCDGVDHSPPLAWEPPPSGTRSLALVVEDPDATKGTFVHWVLFNLPIERRSLDAGIPTDAELFQGAVQGKNDYGRIGYGGPCPPAGPAHRFSFRLYALDQPLHVSAGASRAEVDAAMQGHVVGETELMGRYGRRQ
jgi:Raf kinase inhibitor-like YbhB/YbcL family protein